LNTLRLTENELHIAGEIIRNGGTAVFPTETVYGIGADAFSPDAVAKIFKAKNRPADNPLIVHISEIGDMEKLAREVGEDARALAGRFMPGPITLVLKKRGNIPEIVTAGLDTVGIRFPENVIARKLIGEANTAIAAPSANISGGVSGTAYNGVLAAFDGLVDCIINGGDCDFGIESTVIGLSGERPVILRPGSVTFEMVRDVLPDVVLHPSLLSGGEVKNPASPGMKYKHYSPRAKVVLLDGEISRIIDYFNNNADNACLFMFAEFTENENDAYVCVGSIKDLSQMARVMFEKMCLADGRGFETIYIPAVPETGIGFSIMNRLKKSAGGAVIKV
jgi:L-threonylcarbamoyladenylate synthase